MRWCDEYLNRAMAQVRVKRIREPLAAELRDHLELQKAVYMDAGVPEAEAGRRAIEDMGDPLLVGGALDAAHRPKVCRQGVLIATALLAFGLILRLAFGDRAELALSPLYFIVMPVSAGAIALFACTDYTQWMWTAMPIGSLWAAACIYRILSLLDGAMPMPFAEFPLRSVLLPVPQCLAVALPVLVVLLASRLRGRGWDGFLPCLALPLAGLTMTCVYRDTGYDPGAMTLMILIGFVVLGSAVRGGFFRINRRAALVVISCFIGFALLSFAGSFIRWMRTENDYWDEVIFPMVRYAKPFGRSAGLGLVSEEALSAFMAADAFSIFFPISVIAFCGRIPFLLLALTIAGAFVALFRRFISMENRMGRLLGLSGTSVLLGQAVLCLMTAFARYPENLCLPLLSTGSAMQFVDAVIVGVLLSALRGANLPEPEAHMPRRRMAA